MAKINITFNDINYSIDESSFAETAAELHRHLSTTMSGSGSVVNFGGISYNVDSAKLSSATNDFVTHLGKISGSGHKVVVNGVEYGIDSSKLTGVISDIEAVLAGTGEEQVTTISFTYAHGQYDSDSNKTEHQAVEGMTWAAWIESDYNTDGLFSLDTYGVVLYGAYSIYAESNKFVTILGTDLIISGENYVKNELAVGPGGPE